MNATACDDGIVKGVSGGVSQTSFKISHHNVYFYRIYEIPDHAKNSSVTAFQFFWHQHVGEWYGLQNILTN